MRGSISGYFGFWLIERLYVHCNTQIDSSSFAFNVYQKDGGDGGLHWEEASSSFSSLGGPVMRTSSPGFSKLSTFPRNSRSNFVYSKSLKGYDAIMSAQSSTSDGASKPRRSSTLLHKPLLLS